MSLAPDVIARLSSAFGIEKTQDVDKFHGRMIAADVKAIWNGANFDEAVHASGSTGTVVGVVLDKTNFYAEMGGQEADHGRMVVLRESRSGGGAGETHEGGEFRVDGVVSFGGYVLHVGRVHRGEIRVGDSVELHVDGPRRAGVASNHTATHLLNLCLREVVGEGADQKGSLVAQDRLRFDFAQGRPVTAEELGRIESGVKARIKENLRVHAEAAPLYVAKGVAGVRAVFGEVYPDPVRVVSIGPSVRELLDDAANARWANYSVEFCGGTHVSSTGEIGDFALVSEEAVAKGVRRFMALTGVAARAAHKTADGLEQRLKDAKSLSDAALGAEAAEIGASIDSLVIPAARKAVLRESLATLTERVKAAAKQASAARGQQAVTVARQIAESALMAGDEFIISTIDTGGDRAALQTAVQTVRDRCPKAAVMLMDVDHAEGKVAMMAMVPAALITRGLKAGDWIREAAAVCGGKGGGKPDAAQGGGTDIGKVKEAISAARSYAHKVAR